MYTYPSATTSLRYVDVFNLNPPRAEQIGCGCQINNARQVHEGAVVFFEVSINDRNA